MRPLHRPHPPLGRWTRLGRVCGAEDEGYQGRNWVVGVSFPRKAWRSLSTASTRHCLLPSLPPSLTFETSGTLTNPQDPSPGEGYKSFRSGCPLPGADHSGHSPASVSLGGRTYGVLRRVRGSPRCVPVRLDVRTTLVGWDFTTAVVHARPGGDLRLEWGRHRGRRRTKDYEDSEGVEGSPQYPESSIGSLKDYVRRQTLGTSFLYPESEVSRSLGH